MAGKHNTDPLDFLYEELPPDKMAEARAHLAQCDKCRDETAAIRQLVKTYRDADQPAPPPGLAEKVAAQAMAAAAAPVAAAAAVAPEAEQEEPVRDLEFERLKQEILAESRPGWRAWLFHPAWTVAASVLLICTVLMYISPRRDAVFSPPPPEILPAPAAAPAAASRQRESLPALPRPTLRAKTYSTEQQPVPPLLREAEVLEQQPLPEPAPPPPAAPAAAATAGGLPRDQAGQEAVPVLSPSSPAPPPPHLALPAPESELPAAASAPVFYGGSDAYAPEPSPPPSASALPDMSLPAAPPSPAGTDPMLEEEKAQRDTLSGEKLARDIVDRGFHDAPAVPLQTPEADDMADEIATPAPDQPERAPVIIDMVGEFEPPQLIERPTPIDTVKLARDLTFLAGMQIGNNELSDAWITVGMLRKYDPEKANELTLVLRELEAQQEASENDTPAEPTEPEDPEPEPLEQPAIIPEPSEPAAPESEPESIGSPAPSEAVASPIEEPAAAPARPESPSELDPVENSVDEIAGLSTETETTPNTEISVQEPEPASALVYEPETAVIVIEPEVISPDEPAIVGQGVLIEPEPEFVQEVEIAETPVIAPDVPKSSPDAFPPTLGEMQSARPAQPAPAPERNRFRWFQPREPGYSRFTTDPYWRRD